MTDTTTAGPPSTTGDAVAPTRMTTTIDLSTQSFVWTDSAGAEHTSDCDGWRYCEDYDLRHDDRHDECRAFQVPCSWPCDGCVPAPATQIPGGDLGGAATCPSCGDSR